MLGRKTLLINPPLINGIAFTRQGRCQEREEVLGTTKPPYTLALAASLLRDAGCDVRLIDATAERIEVDDVIKQLDREGFRPSLIVFPTTTPTLDADVASIVRLKRHYSAPIFCFGPHASTAPAQSMERAPQVDGMLVGEPEDAIVRLAQLPSIDRLGDVPSLTWRDATGSVRPHMSHGTFAQFASMPYPAWDLVALNRYALPLVNKRYVIVETSRGCPYTCDFCVCEELIARNLPIQWFGNARADNLTDPAFVHRLKRSGCWMLALGIESESDDVRKDMAKRLERQKIQAAFKNMRDARIRSFAFFIFGYPGETRESMEHTIDYAIELDPDFANFYPAVPYPGTSLYDKCVRESLLPPELGNDWAKMEYSYYVLRGNGLDEQVVMDAINRAKRRFFLRPSYMARHVSDVARIAFSKQNIVWSVLSRTLFGTRVVDTGVRPGSDRGQTTESVRGGLTPV